MKRIGLLRRVLTLGSVLLMTVVLSVSAWATEGDGYTYILDTAGLLETWEADELEAEAASIAADYGFAPYVVTVEDLYGVTATDKALSYYDEHAMGVGENREGSILLLSMAGRDFAYEIWDYTNGVFDSYRRDSVQEAFLTDFREDDWYGGFRDYLVATRYYLTGAADDVEEGEDYHYYGDYTPDYGRYEESGVPLLTILLFTVIIPCGIAGLICAGMLSAMKTVRHAAFAGNYVKGGVKLRIREDVFTHTTETRTRIQKESDHSSSGGGGGGGGGGGHFSSSGKF